MTANAGSALFTEPAQGPLDAEELSVAGRAPRARRSGYRYEPGILMTSKQPRVVSPPVRAASEHRA